MKIVLIKMCVILIVLTTIGGCDTRPKEHAEIANIVSYFEKVLENARKRPDAGTASCLSDLNRKLGMATDYEAGLDAIDAYGACTRNALRPGPPPR